MRGPTPHPCIPLAAAALLLAGCAWDPCDSAGPPRSCDPAVTTDAPDAAPADTPAPPPAAVGAACAADADCAGPGTPRCLAEFKPLEALLLPGADPEDAAEFAAIGLDFPGGYCSTEPPCTADADCGEGGTCYHPLADVDPGTLEDLAAADLPFDTAGLAALSLCLRACQTDADCPRGGYGCAVPLEHLVSLVPGARLDSFCIAKPEEPSDESRPVGSACTSSSQCAGPGTPVCLTEYKPLEDLTDDPSFQAIGLAFQGGYCSTEGNCKTADDCGEGGSCFFPLEHVSQATLDGLGALVPFDVNAFAEAALCMKACASDADCRPGYQCKVPLGDLISLVNGASKDTFCVGPAATGACASLPCQNGGVCIDDGEPAYHCACDVGYSGEHCETQTDPCVPNPCKNGGTCAGGACTCASGWTGPTCATPDTPSDPCDPSPCDNGGTCAAEGDTATCTCPAAYAGPTCATCAAAAWSHAASATCVLDPKDCPAASVGDPATKSCVAACPGGTTRDAASNLCKPDSVDPGKIQLPGPLTLTFPVATLAFTATTAFTWDTTGPPACSDGENNDDHSAAGQGVQDTAVDHPADAECSAPDDDSEDKADFQPQVTVTLTGTVDADGNLTFPVAGIVIPPYYAWSNNPQLGGDKVNKNSFLPTHDATGTLDPTSGAVSLRLRLRVRFEAGTSEFNGPGANCYIGSADAPIDLTLTSSAPYDPATGALALTGSNTAEVPGADVCGFAGLGNGAIDGEFGTPADPGALTMTLTGSTLAGLIVP